MRQAIIDNGLALLSFIGFLTVILGGLRLIWWGYTRKGSFFSDK